MSRRPDGQRLPTGVASDEFSTENQQLLESRLPCSAGAVELVVRLVGIVPGCTAGDFKTPVDTRENPRLDRRHERGAPCGALVPWRRGDQGVTEGIRRDLEPGWHDENGATGRDDLVLG